MAEGSPCKDCPKTGCGAYHDICEKYQAYKKEKELRYEQRKKAFRIQGDLDYIDKLHLKRKRSRRTGVWK